MLTETAELARRIKLYEGGPAQLEQAVRTCGPDPATFIAHALSPAQVVSVSVNSEENAATVVVPDRQLSLAIGREGQNARLAARLTGWRIDIKSASVAEAEEATLAEPPPPEEEALVEELRTKVR